MVFSALPGFSEVPALFVELRAPVFVSFNAFGAVEDELDACALLHAEFAAAVK